MKITLDTDRVTTVLGLIAAFLILQQEFWPNLLEEERGVYVQAVITSLFGFMANKNKKLVLYLNGEGESEEKKEEKTRNKGTTRDEE